MRRFVVVVALTLAAGSLSGCATAQARRDARNVARVNTQLGIGYAEKGRYALALDKLKFALSKDDSLPQTHSAIAVVYQALGEDAEAEKHYRRALDLSEDDPMVRNNFGAFLCREGRAKEAEKYLLEAAQNPRYGTPAAALTNAGICFMSVDPDKAEQYLRKALAVDPGAREPLAMMAELSFRKRDYLRTRAFLQRYDLSQSATPKLLYIAAMTERALGDNDAARRYVQQLKSTFPESEEAASPNLSTP